MSSIRAIKSARHAGFAVETVRALASSLLLLGLIGDRRVR
jgi:hypothetical protein